MLTLHRWALLAGICLLSQRPAHATVFPFGPEGIPALSGGGSFVGATFNPNASPTSGSGLVSFEHPGPQSYSVKILFAPTLNTGGAVSSFAYTLSLTQPGAVWSAAGMTSNVVAGMTGAQFTQEVCSMGYGTGLCKTLTTTDTGTDGFVSLVGFANKAYVFNKYESLSGTTAQISDLTNTFQAVPGPAPILGAAAAFGFSRKLRQRIRAAA